MWPAGPQASEWGAHSGGQLERTQDGAGGLVRGGKVGVQRALIQERADPRKEWNY